MKILIKLETLLILVGGFLVVAILTAGFTGFDIIRLSGGIIQDSGGNTRITVSPTGTNVTMTGSVDFSSTVNMTSQPCFISSTTAQSNVTGDGTLYTVVFSEIKDQANNFVTSTFTFPVDGNYSVSTNVRLRTLNASHVDPSLTVITSNRTYSNFKQEISAATNIYDNIILSLSTVVDADANDTVHVSVSATGSTKSLDIPTGSESNFSVVLQN